MKQRSILWQAAGFAAVTFVGTILAFFHSFVAAEQKKKVLPLVILSNHSETAPLFFIVSRLEPI